MSYNFDYFEKEDRKITITHCGIKMKKKGLLERINNPKFVIVGCDIENAVIGICEAPDNTEYPVYNLRYTANASVNLSCSRLIKQIIKLGILPSITAPLIIPAKIETIDNKKYIIIDLKENK